MSVTEIKQAVYLLDEETLTPELLPQLITYAPSKQEVDSCMGLRPTRESATCSSSSLLFTSTETIIMDNKGQGTQDDHLEFRTAPLVTSSLR